MTAEQSIWVDAEWTRLEVPETGSTNADLLLAAERGDVTDRTVLRTDHQTAGRGRLDRRWDAPPGTNLLASVHLARVGDRAGEAVQRIGVAIVSGITAMVGSARPGLDTARHGSDVPRLGLKWPNDVLLDGRKLAGVLAQRSTTAPGVVVGFGVNVAWSPPTGACVSELVSCSPAELLDSILAAFDRLPLGRHEFAAEYRAGLLTLGQLVRVQLPSDDVFEGTAVDLDADGRLVVQPDRGRSRTFDVGDVVHVRPGSGH